MKTLLLVQVAATLMLTGLIWTIQIVHYPLFDGVGEEEFVEYHQRHNVQITWLVVPLMLTELLTAILMLGARPPEIPIATVFLGLFLVAVIWLSTAFLQVPQHATLAEGFSSYAYQRLVFSNWIRTAAWTARAALMIFFLACILEGD